MMKRQMLAAAMLAMGVGLTAVAPAARADAGDITLDMLLQLGDRNKDRMLTRQEFVEAMGMAYDKHMEKLKKMSDSSQYMKGNAMTRDGLKMLFNDIYHGA